MSTGENGVEKPHEPTEIEVEARILTTKLLITTFKDPKFISNILALIHHGTLGYSEGAFSVENSYGNPSISDLVMSPRGGGKESIQVEITSLLLEDGIRPKTNVFLTVHNHPGKALRPSTTDLETWEKIRLFSPHVIYGILTGGGRLASLLLFQASPSSEIQPYYQQWDTSQSIETLLKHFTEGGIRSDTVTFDWKKGAFTETELQKLGKFKV